MRSHFEMGQFLPPQSGQRAEREPGWRCPNCGLRIKLDHPCLRCDPQAALPLDDEGVLPLAQRKITNTLISVLAQLAAAEGPVLLNVVARALGRKPLTTAAQLKRLKTLGLAVQCGGFRSPWRITDKGRETLGSSR